MQINIFYICFVLVLVVLFLYRTSYAKPIYWFYRKSCGYCKKMEHEWEKFENRMSMSMKIKCIKIDTTDDRNRRLVKDFDIQSVPMIYKIEKGVRYKYEGNRVASEFENWATRNE